MCHLPEEDQSSVARHRSSKPSGAQPSGAVSDQDLPQHDPDPHYCIHRIASGGYYGFDFVTPPPPPQCIERFHRYRSNEKNIIASRLKFAGYIHSHKILPGNIFGLILKNEMAATGVFRL